MAKGMTSDFEDCLKRGKIKKFSDSLKLIYKELRVATSDLKTAKEGLKNNQWKWSTIQAYYSMFHSARALLFSEGYREKSHFCLRIAIDELFVKKGKMAIDQLDAFQTAKIMRENADYEENYSEVGAKKLVKAATDFLKTAKSLTRE